MKLTTQIIEGDCLEAMRKMPDASVDAIVTDPPYGLSFMGKRWDYDVPSVEIWAECLRVLKPGGHLLAFAGTRTQHRMAVRIEDAGFEIRDMIAWIYASGFPKSLDVSKAIDKAAGAEREVLSERQTGWTGTLGGKSALGGLGNHPDVRQVTAPATPAARQWQGWGTALKPSLEPITVARKPLSGTVAENVLAHGTGALNIDGCRVGTEEMNRTKSIGDVASQNRAMSVANYRREDAGTVTGRWPANLIHDGSEEVVGMFPDTKSGKMGPQHTRTTDGSPNGIYGKFDVEHPLAETYGDSGSAARFFYCAKASKADRDEGCEGLEAKELKGMNASPREGHGEVRNSNRYGNHHPTVKPTDLMRYLCRLVTPPGGVVLDPFMGSGSTGKAALAEGFNFIGIERDPQYFQIAQKRAQPPPQTTLPLQ